MRPLPAVVRFGFFLATTLLLTLSSVAQSPEVVFLGTDPVTIGPAPVTAADVGSLGVDADGNEYYADAPHGTVVEMNTEGSLSTLVSGLKNPSIAVDYRGNVFIADTGNNRILESAAGSKRKTNTLAAASAPRAIAVDSADNVFYLGGTSLIELPNGGTPSTVATVASGSKALAFGPALNGTRQLYILALAGGVYHATLYTYPASGSGNYDAKPLVGFLPAISGGTIQSFAVDPHNNAVIVNNEGDTAQVIIGRNGGGTPGDFEHTIYSSQVPTTTIAEDANGSIYFLDSTGLQQIQVGAVNFGLALGGDGTLTGNPYLTFNFGASSNATFNVTNPTGNFTIPSWEVGNYPTSVVVGFAPGDTGLLTGTLSAVDQNGRTLNIPLYGIGNNPWEAYYTPAPNLGNQPPSSSRPVAIVAMPDCYSPAPTCSQRYVLDAASSEFKYAGGIVTGLINPRGLAVDSNGDVYITQIGIPGVLRADVDGTITQISTDLANPIGVALDGPGNLYVTNGDDIVRIAPDGTEAILATPETDGGNKSALCVAVDYQGNIYAGFGITAANPDRGAIVKISPSGAITGIGSDALQPVALATSHGGAIFFTDAARGRISVLGGAKSEKSLAFGLKNPLGLATLQDGTVLVADSELGTVLEIDSGQCGYNFNFGKVPVGSTSVVTLSAVNVGTTFLGVDIQPFSPPTDYLPNQHLTYTNPTIFQLQFTFTPSTLGASSSSLGIYDDNGNLTELYPHIINLTGTGVSATAKAGFTLIPPTSIVTGQPVVIQVEALNADHSLNTGFNGTVSITYTGPLSSTSTPVTGRPSAVLVNGRGRFSFTPPSAGVFPFSILGGGMTTSVNVNVGPAPTSLSFSGEFVSTSQGPQLNVAVTVTSPYTVAPAGMAYFIIDGGRWGSAPVVNGSVPVTAVPVSSLAPGNHSVQVDFIGPPYNNSFQNSSSTIMMLSYNPTM